jgi:hypothetical protein
MPVLRLALDAVVVRCRLPTRLSDAAEDMRIPELTVVASLEVRPRVADEVLNVAVLVAVVTEHRR